MLWSKECNEAFVLAKKKFVSTDVLAHFDSTLLVKHLVPDSTERYIAYVNLPLKSSLVASATTPKWKKKALL